MLMHIILEEGMGFEPMERVTARKFSRFVLSTNSANLPNLLLYIPILNYTNISYLSLCQRTFLLL